MKEKKYESLHSNYLKSVSYEIRFVPLLIIQEDIGKFQKEIRQDYPRFEKGFQIRGVSSSIQEEFIEWVFTSEDGNDVIRMGMSRIAFISKEYTTFEEFWEKLEKIIKSFHDAFQITEFTRIGLRHVNSIPIKGNEIDSETFLKWFKPLINEDILKEFPPFTFNLDYRKEFGDYKTAIRNVFGLGNDGKLFFQIDIDSYIEIKTKKDEIEKHTEQLHELNNDEFYRNVTDDFIEKLKQGDAGEI